MEIEFAWPWLFAMLPLPLLVAWFMPPASASASDTLRIPFYAELQTHISRQSASRSGWFLTLAALAWLALVVAAARPQHIGEPVQLPITGRDLMLAVDLSGSMQADDMLVGNSRVDRLTAVKVVASEFIQRRDGDRLGLILFGRQAYLQAPLTFDRETVRTLLAEAVIGLAGKETALGDAIGLAVKRLREQPQENRVLILLTDGANTAGSIDPLKAADLANQEGIRIYTIGVGADERLVRGLFGQRRVRGSDLDEATLKAIAGKTGGRYFRARDTQALQAIYQLLDRLEPSAEEEQTLRLVDELYRWPLGVSLLISVVIALARLSPRLLQGLREASDG